MARKMKLPNGVGSITKLTGKRRRPFMVRKTTGIVDFKQHMEVIGYYPTYKEALEALMAFNATGKPIEDSIHTFQTVYEAFLEAKFTKYDKSIPSLYTAPYKRCEAIYNVSIEKITLATLEEIVDSAPTPSTKRDTRTMLNQVFEHALKHQYIEKNLVKFVDNITLEKSEKHKPYSLEEMKIIWQHKDEFICKLMLIYIYTGLRPNELLSIKTENVHLDEHYMVGGLKNEYSKNRTIPIADCIFPIIQEFYDPANTYLITNLKRKTKVHHITIERYANDFYEANGMVQHFPHDGRHTCATLLESAGCSITVIQNVLGQSPKTIAGKIYIHISLEDMLAAVNKLPHFLTEQ